MSVLVTGATGSVGRLVVDHLIAAGVRTRALTRDPAAAALPDAAEVVAGDLRQPQTLADALHGAEHLYLFPVPQTAPEVVAAARAAGVRRIVVLSSSSVLGTSKDHHSGEHHRAVERAVEGSGAAWTFLRPGEFASNVLWMWARSIRAEDVVRAPYGDARRVPVHEADVAAVAAASLLEDGHAGRAYVLTGPEAITQADQVAAISRALGRPVAFEEVTRDVARGHLEAAMPAVVVTMVLDHLAASVADPPVPLDTVERVTGRPARTFARWAADHAGDFGLPRRARGEGATA